MSEREDNVYKAKLAEQAERYDGKYISVISQIFSYIIEPLNSRFMRRCSIIDIFDSSLKKPILFSFI